MSNFTEQPSQLLQERTCQGLQSSRGRVQPCGLYDIKHRENESSGAQDAPNMDNHHS